MREYINQASIGKTGVLGDIKTDYLDLFLEILEKMEKFNQEVVEAALI